MNTPPQLKSPEEWAILRGWILYDGRCGLCTQSALRWKASLRCRGFVFVNSLEDEARERSLARQPQALDEMKLVLSNGQTLGGAAAMLEIGRHLWWARPFAWIGRRRFLGGLTDFLYRRVANNRHTISRFFGYTTCGNEGCSIRPR